MANAFYPKYKETCHEVVIGSTTAPSGTLTAALVDTGVYTYSAAHEFLSDISGRVGTDVAGANVTFVDGLIDLDDLTFTGVTGNTVEAVIFYIDTGSAATSPLVAYFDTGITGFPFTPNGGDLNLAVNGSGLAQM